MAETHAAIPAVLYKYRDWANPFHRKLIVERELFFAKPDSFNDSFDAPYCVAPPGTPTNHPLIDRLKLRFPGIPAESLRVLAAAIAGEPNQQFEQDAWSAVFLGLAGVVSLSTSPLESVMWSHYSNNHEGFCVGLSSHGLLADCAAANRKVNLCVVNYVEDRPDYDSQGYPALELLRLHLTTKSSGWSYEREYRLISYFSNAARTLKLSSDTIMEVFLGYRMQDNIRKEILEAIQSIPDVVIRQVRRNRQSFKLDTVCIGTSQHQGRGPEFKCIPTFSVGVDAHCMIVCPTCSSPDRVVIPKREFHNLPEVRCQRCGQQGHVFVLLR